MASIFISYRRGATEDITYRIYEKLKDHFSDVFIDIDNIPGGVRFPDHLASVLEACDVVLAIIGPDWVNPRLQDPDDFLRQELEVAIERELTVIPILVRGASIPKLGQVPASLVHLLEFQAVTVASGSDFAAHIKRLIANIESARAAARPKPPPSEGPIPAAIREAAESRIEGIRLGAIDELSRLVPNDPTGAALAKLQELCSDPVERVARFAQSETERHAKPPPLPSPAAPTSRRTPPATAAAVPPAPDSSPPQAFRSGWLPSRNTKLAALGLGITTTLGGVAWINQGTEPKPPTATPSASAWALSTPIQNGPAPTSSVPSALPSASVLPSASTPPSVVPNPPPPPKKTPKVRMGAVSLSGRLPTEVVQRIVRTNYGRFRLCYEQALGPEPNLEGQVSVRFVIGRDGAVSSVMNAGSSLPDAGAVTCVVSSFYGLSFPQPEGGIVAVTYTLTFSPD